MRYFQALENGCCRERLLRYADKSRREQTKLVLAQSEESAAQRKQNQQPHLFEERLSPDEPKQRSLF